MKKIFTLSLGLATGLVALAITPEVVVSEQSTSSMEGVKVNLPEKSVVERAIRKASALNAPLGVPSQQLPADKDVNMYYANPEGTFSGALWITRPDGNKSYFYLGTMTAPYSSLTYSNKSSYVENNKYLNIADGDYSFAWTNYTSEYVGNEPVKEDAFDLTFNSEVNEYAGYGWHAPTMYLGDRSYRKPRVWNDEESNMSFQCGGKLITDERLEEFKQANPTYSDFHYVGHTFSIVDPRYSGSYLSGVFGTGTDKTDGVTATQDCAASFEELNEYSGVTGITDIEAFFQDVKVVTPMAISAAYIRTLHKNLKDAHIKVEFYYLENGEIVGEPFNSLDYDYPSTTKRSETELKIPFKSQDATGFYVDYMIIEKDFRIIISGVNDSKFREFYLPLVGMDCYGDGKWPGSWAHAYRPSAYNEFKLGAIVKGEKDGVDGSYAVRSTYFNGMENEDKTSTAIDPVSFSLGFDVEYPYLQTDAAALNGATLLEPVEIANEYSVNIKNADQTAVYKIMCPGSVDDVIVETVEGEDVPEWLYYEVSDAIITKPADYADDTPNYFALVLALADGAQPGGCEVKVSYKGMSNIFKVNPDLSGIEGVVDNGVETVASEYYDLQGRKLYNEPANGLFIRKDIKADGSVKSVKVVK